MTTKLRFADEQKQITKAELRAYAKKRRMENVNRDVKEELLIENFYTALLNGKEGAGARLTFFIYLSFFLEAPTDKLIKRLLSDGHTVCCPRIEKGEMEAVLYSEDLALSDFGIREPIGNAYQGKIDVVVAPLLAVDRAGNRLGYGGGYYDGFLKNTTAKRVGYGYQFQVVRYVPATSWDEKMQLIITDEEIIQVEKDQ